MLRFAASCSLLLLAAPLAGGCDTAEPEKINPEDCEKLAERMVTHTVMERAQNAAQLEELKRDLKPKYLEACKAEPPNKQAFACAMAAPNSAAMAQCQ
jgi:hypothetical protein